jgi:EAL domain-containing protein (putative c-di-GMP-specific phosphodiesterase class I)
VLDQALAAMKRWRALGIEAPVAVNASPRSLLDPTFALMVRDRLAHYDVAGSDLVIELTETLTLSQVDLIGGVLRQLRDAGVLLALDDFGTRSSSLAMLAKVPFFELKIDRSFVSGMGARPRRWPSYGPPWSSVARCTATWWPRAWSTTTSGSRCGRWGVRPVRGTCSPGRCRSTT